jgi:tetraprenyl-beta-curcumene synthase
MSWSGTSGYVRAAARELAWGLRLVSREVEHWRERARAIPDAMLRADALAAIERKRGNINGAALFWTLPDRRNHELLRVLVAYEILADFIDCASERGAARGVANGRQLHLALAEALDPAAETSDYYRHHDRRRDGGFLDELVQSCRTGCAALPSYELVRPVLARATALAPVLALNHEPDASLRERALREWAPSHLSTPRGADAGTLALSWFERTAGASAWLTVLAMLALAAETGSSGRSLEEIERTYDTYLHWIAPAGAMLDSYGDIPEDLARGDHSYIAHYPSIDVAVDRLGELIRGSRRGANALASAPRHSLIVACMVAFYLSKDSVLTPAMAPRTRELRRAGGPLVTALWPALRLWRIGYGQRAA